MGKSPGRWIKKVLFGKKTSKSNSGQGKQKPVSGKEVHVRAVAGETGVNDNPLEVSSGGLSAVHVDELNLSSDYRDASYVQQDQDIQKPGNQNADVGQMRELDALTDEEKIVQEKAAKKTQSANETGVVDNPPVVSSGGLSAVHVDKLNLSSDYREASYVQRDQDIPKPGDQNADVGETRELDVLTDEERILQEKAAKKAQAASETDVDDNPPEVSSGGLSAVHVNELNLSSDYREASYVQQDQDVPEHGDQNADVGQMRELDTFIDEEGIVQENSAKKTQEASYVQRDQDIPEPGDQNADVGQMREIDTLTDDERIVQEKAAKKTQAAFRGYVARREYKALKGIIMLQALIRGHLVRRQAVATLYCVVGIVKLQALVRGSRARRSDVGIEVQRVCFVKPEDMTTSFDGDVESASAANLSPLSANVFIRKLLAPSAERMPLRVQYDETDSNSVQIWLERWSISCPWRPVSPPKKATNSKILKKTGNTQSVEGDIVKSKRSVRKVPSRFDNASAQSVPELEKPRRNAKKVSSHPADSVEENPQKELEKVKRSLRKVNSTGIESSTSAEVTEGPPHSQAKPTSSVKDEPVFLLKKETTTVPTENKQQTVEDPVENVKDEPIFLLNKEAAAVPTENDQQITEDPVQTSQFIDVSNDETKEGPIQTSQSIDVSNDETTEDPILTSQSIDVSIDASTEAKVEPAEGDEKVENTHVPKGELKPTADSLPSESQKSSRKASLSATQEEDSLQKSSSPAEVIEGPPHSQVEPIFVQEVPDPIEENPIENMKDEPVLLLKEEATTVRTENDQQTTEDPSQTSQSIDVSNDESTKAKVEPSEGNEKVEITHVANGKLKPTTDSLPSESQKSSRRASLSAKHEHEEDGLQNTPKLPSYMQATKSAKAKLRGQGSPKLDQDSAEKSSPMRRHSLPTTANGKVSSASPRTPKILHGSAKGGNKSDKSLLSSREGNVLPGKATKEWRR